MVSVGASVDEMDLIADSVGLATTNMRISILDQDGMIIGDSFYDEHRYANFATENQMPEIKDAFSTGNGKSIRQSDYLKAQTFSYALKYAENGMIGVIRVPMPMQEVNEAIFRLR